MKFSQLPTFDLHQLSSETVRGHYRNVLARIDEVAASFVAGYKPAGTAATLTARFVESPQFNASTWAEGDTTVIGLSAAMIPLLSTLFSILLSDANVLPALPALSRRQVKQKRKALFSLDPLQPTALTEVTLALSEERAAAAHVLSDLCVSFIYLHEIGHVVCGHVGASQHFMGGDGLTEYVASKDTPQSQLWLRQYWEYQADAIAAALVPQYLDTLLTHADQRHQWIRRLAIGRRSKSSLPLHLAALSNMSLAIMFHYLEGCRLEHAAEAAHPHPVVRSLYVKDILARQAATRWSCDPRKIGKLQYSYLEPFLFALAAIGLGSVRDWDVKVLSDMEKEVLEVSRGAERREVARPWSWLPVEQW
jgi:hypothetical protein